MTNFPRFWKTSYICQGKICPFLVSDFPELLCRRALHRILKFSGSSPKTLVIMVEQCTSNIGMSFPLKPAGGCLLEST